jgi:hypothetical protein
MIIDQNPQGSEAWHKARAKAITASTFGDAVSIVGGLTDQQKVYVQAMLAGKPEAEALAAAGYKAKPTADGVKKALAGQPVGEPSDASNRLAVLKAIEWISGKPYGYRPDRDQGFYATERGHEEEGFGRMIYEGRNQVIVDECGLILTDDGLFGYSPDGLVGDDGLIECKTPLNPLKVLQMVQTGDASEYMHQIQGGLWITGRKWCDLIMPVPDLACLNNGNELYVKRIYRDDDFIDDMVEKLWAFAGRVKRYEAILRAPYSQAANDALGLLRDAA